MDKHTAEFLHTANAGDPVYITDVRKAYLGLTDGESFPIDLAVTTVSGGLRRFGLRLPRFLGYPQEGSDFVAGFFLAEAYNILSSLGGRAVDLLTPESVPEVETLLETFRERFELELPRHLRLTYGKAVNVMERMLDALFPGSPEAERRFRIGTRVPDDHSAPPENASPGRAVEILRGAAADLEGKTILGMDIGGTDIKLVLVHDGALLRCLEYDWHPAAFTSVEELIRPIRTLVELMAALGSTAAGGAGVALEKRSILEPALAGGASLEMMARILSDFRAGSGGAEFRFDAIGMCFPDVVVGDKIVGGETSKTRGIRGVRGGNYDREFARLTVFGEKLRPFVKDGGIVGIINDGPMAAFTAGIENALANSEAVADGVFAHTLGTELGTGWVTAAGAIPDIPLEVYNFIVDLGSFPERMYGPDDLRSLNNFNTGLPGTLQKYTSQSGVFRLAAKRFPGARPDLMRELRDKGFVVERGAGGGSGLFVPVEPEDLRKPFLEHMMNLARREDDSTVRGIFEEIGAALAVCGEEVDWILRPALRRRTLFGRLVKHAVCFDLMNRGALARDRNALLAVADDTIAETPLMRALADDPGHTVAQFAQAVGAVHYANHRLRGGR
ncbi:MAG: hypothetical protein LBT97_13365 [Planctomycetota bacterium]|jgi:hypothetical protein|nr:hypothetical protein [Planctomycetota bacterium]